MAKVLIGTSEPEAVSIETGSLVKDNRTLEPGIVTTFFTNNGLASVYFPQIKKQEVMLHSQISLLPTRTYITLTQE